MRAFVPLVVISAAALALLAYVALLSRHKKSSSHLCDSSVASPRSSAP
ncbi:MAG TPA: hypothetical protein VHU19_18305 [Pyrinomonadaceae bacterium]|nr:hypothetical protein [Pyrinomonadaceae bacterium]